MHLSSHLKLSYIPVNTITLLKIFEKQKLWTLTLPYLTVTCAPPPHTPITKKGLPPPPPPHPKKVDSGSTNGLHTLYTVTVHTKDKKSRDFDSFYACTYLNQYFPNVLYISHLFYKCTTTYTYSLCCVSLFCLSYNYAGTVIHFENVTCS